MIRPLACGLTIAVTVAAGGCGLFDPKVAPSVALSIAPPVTPTADPTVASTTAPTVGAVDSSPTTSGSPAINEDDVIGEERDAASIDWNGMIGSILSTGLLLAKQCLPVLEFQISGQRGSSRGQQHKSQRKFCYVITGAAVVLGLASSYQASLEARAREQQRRQAELALADLEADNERTRQYIATSREWVEERNPEIRLIRHHVASRKLSREEAERSLAGDRDRIEEMKRTIRLVENSGRAYQESAATLQASPAESAELRRKIREREALKAELEKVLEDYLAAGPIRPSSGPMENS